MDEKKPESPWDELVEDLGVEADPASTERRQPKPTELPSISREKHIEPPKSKPGDWNALAGSLGLEVPAAEPVLESAAVRDKPQASGPVASEPEVEAQSEPDFVEVVQETESEPFDELPELRSEFDKELVEATGDSDLEEEESGISGEAARDAFDALFAEATSDWEMPSSAGNILDTPLEFSHPSEAPSAESSEFDSDIAEEEKDEENKEDQAEKRPKRRRPRRRRGRGGRKTETESEDIAAETDDVESAPAVEEDAAEPREKPRRRRSRRRGRRKESEGGAEVTAESDSLDAPAVDDSELDGEDDEFDQRQSSRQRASHRNLPTWSEAIGGIVDGNLQQRSKSPSKPTSSRSRGRGGKGRRKKQS